MKEKNRLILLLFIIILVILGLVFYWFQWRPNEIVKLCNKEAVEKAKAEKYLDEAEQVYNVKYKSCLRDHGLEK